MRTKLLALGATTLLVVAACNDTKPTPDPALAFCDSLDALAQSVATVEALGPTATVDEAETAIEAVAAAAGEVRDAAGDLAESQVEAIEDAVDSLREYRSSIEGSETIAEVYDGLLAEVAAVRQARQEAGQVNCGLEEVEAEAEEAQATLEAEAGEAQATLEAAAEGVQATLEAAVEEAQATLEAAVEE